MRKSNLIFHIAILLVGLTSTSTILADVKIKVRQTMSGPSYENTTYIKGKRMRVERLNPQSVSMLTSFAICL